MTAPDYTNHTPCIACGAFDAEVESFGETKTYGVREFGEGHAFCYWCYYTGRGYSFVHAPLIAECRKLGVDMTVVHTGGGCQNFRVVIDPNPPTDDDEDGTDVLLGDALDPLADTFLGICINHGDGYAEKWTHDMELRFPAPPLGDTRTPQTVAQWMHRVVVAIRHDLDARKFADA